MSIQRHGGYSNLEVIARGMEPERIVRGYEDLDGILRGRVWKLRGYCEGEGINT